MPDGGHHGQGLPSGTDTCLWRPRTVPGQRLRLICFPYAGGGAGTFRSWDGQLGEAVEICAVQLPGREWRRRESPRLRLEELVAELLEALSQGWLDGPYALFGYSMGAVLAFELVRRLRQAGLPQPVRLFAAACRAPQLMPGFMPIYRLPQEEFLARIRRFGGTPDSVLADPDLLQLLLPVLRADFEALGTYRYLQQPPFAFPITVYGGTRDPHAACAALSAWRAHSTAGFALRLFNGGHFFINEARGQLLRTLASDLAAG